MHHCSIPPQLEELPALLPGDSQVGHDAPEEYKWPTSESLRTGIRTLKIVAAVNECVKKDGPFTQSKAGKH